MSITLIEIITLKDAQDFYGSEWKTNWDKQFTAAYNYIYLEFEGIIQTNPLTQEVYDTFTDADKLTIQKWFLKWLLFILQRGVSAVRDQINIAQGTNTFSTIPDQEAFSYCKALTDGLLTRLNDNIYSRFVGKNSVPMINNNCDTTCDSSCQPTLPPMYDDFEQWGFTQWIENNFLKPQSVVSSDGTINITRNVSPATLDLKVNTVLAGGTRISTIGTTPTFIPSLNFAKSTDTTIPVDDNTIISSAVISQDLQEIDTEINKKANQLLDNIGALENGTIIDKVLYLDGSKIKQSALPDNNAKFKNNIATNTIDFNTSDSTDTNIYSALTIDNKLNLKANITDVNTKANKSLNNIDVLPQVVSTSKAMFRDVDGQVKEAPVSSQSSTTWGSIIGTLSNQTDLNSILNDKAGISIPNSFIAIQNFLAGLYALGDFNHQGNYNLTGNQNIDGNLTLNTNDSSTGALTLNTNPNKTNQLIFDDYSGKPRMSWFVNKTRRGDFQLKDDNSALTFSIPLEGVAATNPNSLVVYSQLPNLSNYATLAGSNLWIADNNFNGNTYFNGVAVCRTPTLGPQIANKKYVDDQLGFYVKNYVFNLSTPITSQLDSTNPNAVNLKIVMDATSPGVFDDWVSNRKKYVIQAFVEDKAGGIAYQGFFTSTGTTELSSNTKGRLFSCGIIEETPPANGTAIVGLYTMKGWWTGEPNGDMRLEMVFGTVGGSLTRNGNFNIRSISIFQLY